MAPLAQYLAELERWNRAVSLTSIHDRDTLALRYVIEPAAALPALAGAGPRMLDAGSGGGCLGGALRILEPQRDVLLVGAKGLKAPCLR